MSRSPLTDFSYVVLILVGRDGAGPHDLLRMARRGRIYGRFADSQWYAEPKRLKRLGFLSSRSEPGKTRQRTHYELTDLGREALMEWVAEPTPFSHIQLDPAYRVLAADLVGDAAVLRSLEGLHEAIADMLAMLDEGDATAESVPHRTRYLRLNHRLARRIVEAHRDWLEEVERELGPERGTQARARKRSR